MKQHYSTRTIINFLLGGGATSSLLLDDMTASTNMYVAITSSAIRNDKTHLRFSSVDSDLLNHRTERS